MQKAVLVGVTGGNDPGFEKSMNEMLYLAEADDMEVVQTFTQGSAAVNPGTFIGEGKIEEIRAVLERDKEIGTVLFNDALSPQQMKNLIDRLDRDVLDRTGLILQIFSRRAGTREARAQVEYANLQYMLPRLAGLHKELGRQGGGSGAMSNKGAGETKIELDRRKIEHRCTMLRRELETVDRERETQRGRRQRSGIPLVSLVGYTNAGKSTILNGCLDLYGGDEEKKVFEENMLFATLDTTVRRICPDGGRRPFLLSDTVGFISNLPTTLVKAFRSTLEEVKYADILLIVSDVSDPEYREDLRITVQTLKEIGAGSVPRIYIFNKCDLAGIGPSADVTVTGIGPEDGHITMSAKNTNDIGRLIDLIEEKINRGRVLCEMLIPYTDGGTLSKLKASSDIEILEYEESGVRIRGHLRREDAERYKKYRTE